MPDAPLVLNVVLVAVLVASIAAAFFGRAPRSRRPLAAAGVAMLSVLLYAAGAVEIWARQEPTTGGALVFAGVEAMCLAAWLGRERRDERRPGDDDGDPDDPEPPSGDWPTFEAALRRWQPRAPAGEPHAPAGEGERRDGGDRPREPAAG